MKDLWVVPNNDLEAKTIIELLQKNGKIIGEDILVTGQGWGASWEGLEEEIKEKLEENMKAVKTITEIEEEPLSKETNGSWTVERRDFKFSGGGGGSKQIGQTCNRTGTYYDYLNDPAITTEDVLMGIHDVKSSFIPKYREIEKEVPASIPVYGVELQGNNEYGGINIDHHIYGEDDRSNPKSSIEQVANLLDAKLSIDEQFVAANDKGYIPAMEKLGRKLGLEENIVEEIIADIRKRDREMQGVTPEQEEQAEEAIAKLGEINEKQDYIQLDLPHSKTSTVTDRLFGKYDNLLITSADGETNFFGTTDIIKMLDEKFPGGWSGGQLDQGSGFWGGYADQNAIKEAVQELITQIREAKKDRAVTPRDIAEADKEQSLTTTELGGIKGFFKKIKDKIKGIFQEKGE